jgi:hypothetical protein
MADKEPPKLTDAMLELDSEWNDLRVMAILCHQMFEELSRSGFDEDQALRLVAYIVKED